MSARFISIEIIYWTATINISQQESVSTALEKQQLIILTRAVEAFRVMHFPKLWNSAKLHLTKNPDYIE